MGILLSRIQKSQKRHLLIHRSRVFEGTVESLPLVKNWQGDPIGKSSSKGGTHALSRFQGKGGEGGTARKVTQVSNRKTRFFT